MMRGLRALALALTVRCALAAAQTAAPPPPYRVIVHPRNQIVSMERSTLADVFLKKVTRWRNGDVILPVDQSSESIVRRRFTDDVLARSVAAVRSYWQQLIFAGRDIPPPELESDEEVAKYVGKHPGAIGYVSGATEVAGTKVIAVK